MAVENARKPMTTVEKLDAAKRLAKELDRLAPVKKDQFPVVVALVKVRWPDIELRDMEWSGCKN